MMATKLKPSRGFLNDLIGLIGMSALAYGCWLVYPPSAYIVTGLILFAVGVLHIDTRPTAPQTTE